VTAVTAGRRASSGRESAFWWRTWLRVSGCRARPMGGRAGG